MEAVTSAAQSLAPLSAARGAAPARAPEAPSSAPPAKPAPVMDEYVPGEERTPSGLYWIGRGGDGAPKVCFDDPEGKPAETCTTNTDKVDRELEGLRSRAEKLERRLEAETDGSKARELRQKLAQAQAELAQKDNDAYRRRNAVIS